LQIKRGEKEQNKLIKSSLSDIERRLSRSVSQKSNLLSERQHSARARNHATEMKQQKIRHNSYLTSIDKQLSQLTQMKRRK
jgi:uncharacterized protein involved in exopolysaccharide biosynthesis